MKPPKAIVRYAHAAIESAKSNNAIDALYGDMLSIVKTLKSSKDLVEFLKNPIISLDIKVKALNNILPNLSKLSIALIDVISQNRRIEFLGNIANKIIEISDKEKGKIKGKIITAVELDEKLKLDILDKICTSYKEEDIVTENKIDESILGGFIARIGDKEYDASISGSLNRLKTELL